MSKDKNKIEVVDKLWDVLSSSPIIDYRKALMLLDQIKQMDAKESIYLQHELKKLYTSMRQKIMTVDDYQFGPYIERRDRERHLAIWKGIEELMADSEEVQIYKTNGPIVIEVDDIHEQKKFKKLSLRDKALYFVLHGNTDKYAVANPNYITKLNTVLTKSKRMSNVTQRSIGEFIKMYNRVIKFISDEDALKLANEELKELNEAFDEF